MIYSQTTGGLGNQMYNYAIGYALAKTYNDDLTIDISPYKFSPRPFVLDQLAITGKVKSMNPPLKDSKLFRMAARILRILHSNQYGRCKWMKESNETRNQYFNYDFSHSSSLYLEGYWQNYRYFDDYCTDLCKEFSPKEKLLSESCNSFIENCKKENSVALHIRRGDYEAAWLLDEAYYTKALEIMNSKISSPKYYVFCEDIPYAKALCEKLNNSVLVTESYNFTDMEEFFAMSACQNQIIANSSYSWWAAYLNQHENKLVIAPETMHWARDYYPIDWVTISV